jgi:hypothetical protein
MFAFGAAFWGNLVKTSNQFVLCDKRFQTISQTVVATQNLLC